MPGSNTVAFSWLVKASSAVVTVVAGLQSKRSAPPGVPVAGSSEAHSSGAAPAAPPASPKVAIVLFNLGGPDRPEAIKPFLLNLFLDPAILRVPFFVRPFLARIIARARVAPATANYALLGGRSPLLGLTREQAAALEAALPEMEARCFIAMRYWHPFSLEAARAVKSWAPDEVVLLPLYPQFSTTTTGSSLAAWRQAAVRVGLAADTTTVCCYPVDPPYAASTADLIKAHYARAREQLDPAIPLRVLFSAHGLPEIIIQNGDPYQWQVEQTVAAVLAAVGRAWIIAFATSLAPPRRNGSVPAPTRKSSALPKTKPPCSSCRSRSSLNIPKHWSNSMWNTAISQ